MAAYDLTMRVWRGDSTGGGFATYNVPGEAGEVVLDVVHRLQATQANDLAVRWNCKAGKCGSCSAEINGQPRLMCMTRLNSLDVSEPITITPMRTFPVIRDLVTDVSFNYEKARRMPAFAPPSDNKGGKFRMQQVDVERSQEFRKCIECFMCQNVCHVIRDHDDNKESFAGPRMFIKYAELEMHPLDTNDRRELLREKAGLGFCNITKCCTEVCPEHIKITDNAIIPMKERVVDVKYDPIKLFSRVNGQKTVVDEAGGSGPDPIKRPSPPVQTRASRRAAAAATAPSSGPAGGSSGSGALARVAHAPAAVANQDAVKRWGPAVAVAALGIGALLRALRRRR